jgi:23S rRNA G2445 N2-methylase RlmL
MKSGEKNPDKELYRQLRALSCEQLWEDEVPAFDRASPDERRGKVSLVRAVGVVFSESGTAAQRDEVRPWLRRLLQDPCEKIRRYAMAALPKIGAGTGEEKELLSLLRTTTEDREKKFLGRTLEKIGGAATLKEMAETGLHLRTEQKVRASVARSQRPSIVRMDRTLTDFAGLRIHLRGRAGLEGILRDEVEEAARKHGKFRVAEVRTGLVAVTPMAPFSPGDIYALRCFDTVGFVLGDAGAAKDAEFVARLAAMITSPLSRRLLETFTEGSIRYRLDFVALGHQRGAVRLVVNRAYELCPEILNDARSAPWTIAVHPAGRGNMVELTPRFTPDPRLAFRLGDVPAASHPPLAACMARLAGQREDEIVWDPFCGSGLELIERALLGGVRAIYGTDRSREAVAISSANFAAAHVKGVRAEFTCCDFRDFAKLKDRGPESVTLVISNPPMGKRVPIADLRGLIGDLFSAAATVLVPGGRLVFANPLAIENPHRALTLQSRQTVDFSGFDCRLEKYVKRS